MTARSLQVQVRSRDIYLPDILCLHRPTDNDGNPGKTAPRLIQDLLDYDPRFPASWNVLAEVSPIFREGQTLHVKDPRACRHALCAKENQSRPPVSSDARPNENTVYVVAAYCSRCRYHFEISVDHHPRRAGQVPCHLSDGTNPLHHFRLVDSIDGKQYKEKNGINKYDLLTEAHTFRCTGSACPVTLEIKVSPPRLAKGVMVSILDANTVFNRGKREMEKEPERYVGQKPVTPAAAIGYLRQYLTDAKTTTATPGAAGGVKRIARRNKKFMLAFADECDALYEYLDFKLVEEPGVDEGVSHVTVLEKTSTMHLLTSAFQGGDNLLLATSNHWKPQSKLPRGCHI